jgi:adenylate kinase family enzyme
VKGVLDRGDLVTDEIVIALIEDRLPEAEAAGGPNRIKFMNAPSRVAESAPGHLPVQT